MVLLFSFVWNAVPDRAVPPSSSLRRKIPANLAGKSWRVAECSTRSRGVLPLIANEAGFGIGFAGGAVLRGTDEKGPPRIEQRGGAMKAPTAAEIRRSITARIDELERETKALRAAVEVLPKPKGGRPRTNGK